MLKGRGRGGDEGRRGEERGGKTRGGEGRRREDEGRRGEEEGRRGEEGEDEGRRGEYIVDSATYNKVLPVQAGVTKYSYCTESNSSPKHQRQQETLNTMIPRGAAR